MSVDDDLGFTSLGSHPVPVPRLPRSMRRVAHTVPLPAGPDRRARAQAAVDQLVEPWALPALRARQWLAAAGEELAGSAPLELFLQLDGTTDLLTLELWDDGRVVFGIDDWLGV